MVSCRSEVWPHQNTRVNLFKTNQSNRRNPDLYHFRTRTDYFEIKGNFEFNFEFEFND